LHIYDIKPPPELETDLLRRADVAKTKGAVQPDRSCVV
jgi:uncharacterized UPF0146 family protein